MNNKHFDYKRPSINSSLVLKDLNKHGKHIPLNSNPGFLNISRFVALLAGILVVCGTFWLLEDGLLLLEIKTYYSTFSDIAFRIAANIIGAGCTIVGGKDFIALQLTDQDLILEVIKAVLPYLHHPAFFLGLVSLMLTYLNSNPKANLDNLNTLLDLDSKNKTYFLWGMWFACINYHKNRYFPFEGNVIWFQGANSGAYLINILLLLAPIYPGFSKEALRFKLFCTAKLIAEDSFRLMEEEKAKKAKERAAKREADKIKKENAKKAAEVRNNKIAINMAKVSSIMEADPSLLEKAMRDEKARAMKKAKKADIKAAKKAGEL